MNGFVFLCGTYNIAGNVAYRGFITHLQYGDLELNTRRELGRDCLFQSVSHIGEGHEVFSQVLF